MADKKNNINLKRYETDVSGLSLNKLEAGLWWAKNWKNLKNIFILILILIAIASWGYTIFGFGYYLLVGMNADNQMAIQNVQSTLVGQTYLDKNKPKTPLITAQGFIADNGKYDLYAKISNPNSIWLLNFDYCFQRLDQEQSCGKGFILPGENKYIINLGQSFTGTPNDLSLSLANITWTKIDNHDVPDWKSYQQSHLNIIFNNQAFTPAATNAVSDKIGLNTLSFDVSNDSAYGFWEMPFDIILTDGGRIVYLDRYTADKLKSGETRSIQTTWPGAFTDVTGIEIEPDLNILDPTVYLPPQ